MLELPNACFNFEIGLSYLKMSLEKIILRT